MEDAASLSAAASKLAETEAKFGLAKAALDDLEQETTQLTQRDEFLVYAARGDSERVRVLLDQGASPDRRDFAGCCALSLAAEGGHALVIALLLDRGASVLNSSLLGWTALMHAALHDCLECAYLLILNEAPLNAHALQNRRTALHFAARWGHRRMVRMLLDAGAREDVVDLDGCTARDLAEQWHHYKTMKEFDVDHFQQQKRDTAKRDSSERIALPADYLVELAPERATVKLLEVEMRQWLRDARTDLSQKNIMVVAEALTRSRLTSRFALAGADADELSSLGLTTPQQMQTVCDTARSQLPNELRPPRRDFSKQPRKRADSRIRSMSLKSSAPAPAPDSSPAAAPESLALAQSEAEPGALRRTETPSVGFKL